MHRQRKYFSICLSINLLVGNAALLMFPDLTLLHRLLISVLVFMIYYFGFRNLLQQPSIRTAKLRMVRFAILLSLSAMLVTCIISSIAMRLAMDCIFTAALKGIVPLFIFSLVFGAPFWIPLAAVNYFCLRKVGEK